MSGDTSAPPFLTAVQVRSLAQGDVPTGLPGAKIVTGYEDGRGRWHRYRTVVFQIAGDWRLYAATYAEGATEYQENDYPAQRARVVEEYEHTETRYRVVPQEEDDDDKQG